MTREEMIEDIKISLGSPVIELENESILGQIVDKAFKEVKRYITETRYVTIPYSRGPIDTSGCNINTIVQIFRTSNPNRVTDFTDIYSLSTINAAYTSTTNVLLSDYFYRTQMHQLKSTITTDLDFTYDKENNKLYVNTFYPTPVKLTLAFIPDFHDVSEVREQYWINLINRLALAFAKINLGRIRGKYELSSSLYKLDADTMLSEGISERDAVRTTLDDNSDLVFPID